MRRIKRAEVKRLALCKRGKNGLKTLYKSDGTAEFATLTKGNADKGELLSVMWPKGLADADGDFADTDAAIDSMMSSLIANGGTLDIEHEGAPLTRDQARIAEVFRIQPNDERFAGWQDYDGNAVDVSHGAAVRVQIDDPALRKAFRDGEFDGVSLFGPAAVEEIDTKAASQRVAARMGGSKQEIDMTKEELQAALDAQEAKMVALVKSTIEGALKAQAPASNQNQNTNQDGDGKPATAELEVPTFTGDPLDAEALASYERALRGYELRKAIASGEMTADKLAELRKSLTERQPSVEDLNDAGIPAKAEDSAEVRALQVKLFKAQRGSNAPLRSRDADDEVDELRKASENEGKAIAALINEQMGNASQGMRVVQG